MMKGVTERELVPLRFLSISLECDGDRYPYAGARTIVQVVPIVGVIKIYVVGFVPSVRPHFRPGINERDPIAVIAEARVTADEDHGQSVNAEEVVPSPVRPEARFWYAVAVVAAALAPGTVVVIPRPGARLAEAAAHLLLLLRNAAMVDAAVSRAIGPDAAVISAAVCLPRSCLALRRSTRLRLTLLCWPLVRLRGLLVLLRGLLTRLRGLPFLMLLPLRFSLPLTLLVTLSVGKGSGRKKQQENSRTDNACLFHVSMLLLSANGP